MRRYAPVYYLLFVMLIMGAFASMAQNAYGIKMIGFVAMAFAMVFGWQLFDKKNEGGPARNTEAVSLIVMAIILGMRVFYLRFAYVELIFAFAAAVLIIVYSYKASVAFRQAAPAARSGEAIAALFYVSIIFYLISLAAMPFAPEFAYVAGIVGFAALIMFVLVALFASKTVVEGEKVPVYKLVSRKQDRSLILISLFILFTAYAALTKINALPPLYDDEFPRAYYQLINEVGRGEVKLIDGQPKHEEYKRMYSRFVKRNKK